MIDAESFTEITIQRLKQYETMVRQPVSVSIKELIEYSEKNVNLELMAIKGQDSTNDGNKACTIL